MSPNTVCPFPKEYDTPSEKVRKTIGVSDSFGNGKMVLDDMIPVLDILHHVNFINSSSS